MWSSRKTGTEYVIAWNEPGGNDQKDPRSNNQGPPDLDEAFRRFRDKLGGAFGGTFGGAGGGGSVNGGLSGSVFALVLALAGPVLGLSGCLRYR